MDAGQMLAHCAAIFENANGDRVVPRMFAGRLLGPLFKSQFSNEKAFSKEGPTSPAVVIKDRRDFANEKQKLLVLIDRFGQRGPAGSPDSPHFFFGRLSPDERGKGMYKHLDHHLKQFNA